MTARRTSLATHPSAARAQRWLRRVTGTLGATTAGSVLLLGAPADSLAGSAAPAPQTTGPETTAADLAPVAADPHRWPGHPGRSLVRYRVRPGDTATGLAVRFHAWTDELRALNHLGRHSRLLVGQRLRIPVVARALRPHKHAHRKLAHKPHASKPRPHRPRPHPPRAHRQASPPWQHADVGRSTVRRLVVRTALHHHVNPNLALAIAWQESGWQQRRLSSARAVGVMQVLPGTADWMSSYAGRRLNPYALQDNVTAGVVLIKVLQSQTGPTKAVAAYYQGLGSVQKHGLHPTTKAYVRSVAAVQWRIAHGRTPA